LNTAKIERLSIFVNLSTVFTTTNTISPQQHTPMIRSTMQQQSPAKTRKNVPTREGVRQQKPELVVQEQ